MLRSAACPACGRLLTVTVTDDNTCTIPAHRHKGKSCDGGEHVAVYRSQLTAAQAVTQARELLEKALADKLPAPLIVPTDVKTAVEVAEQSAPVRADGGGRFA